jgi:hypothetical protein
MYHIRNKAITGSARVRVANWQIVVGPYFIRHTLSIF